MPSHHLNTSTSRRGVPSLIILILVATAASLPFSTALPSFDKTTHVVRDLLPEIPNDYDYLHPAPSHYILPTLRIGLAQPNFHLLEETLYSISDPSLPSYGAYLSHDQVEAFVRPSKESTVAVKNWLLEHGFSEESWKANSAGDWWTLENVPVGKAEKMMNCEFAVFKHRQSGLTTVRTLEYGIPLYLDEHIDVIQPTTMFASVKPMHSLSTMSVGKVSQNCSAAITPQCLKDLYGTNGYVPSTKLNNSIGITGYLEQYFNMGDLHQFLQTYLPDAATSDYNLSVISINNSWNNQSNPGSEASLDVQYTSSLTFPIPNTFYTIAGRPPYIPDLLSTENFNEPYHLFTDYLLSLSKNESLPSVISTSYDDNEQTVPKSYAVRVCNSFAQIGARGVSLVFSSGDGGVGGCQPTIVNGHKGVCLSNDGKNTTKFLPTFPSSCPYVTSVGATSLTTSWVGGGNEVTGEGSGAKEVAVGFSSGGFSEYFEVPSYQAQATSGYLEKLGGKYRGLYNPGGRGIPDVSAQGVHFHVIQGGTDVLESGTSASCPTFASIITLLNDYRLRNGQPVMGFLNPWLYTVGFMGLNDILSGNNPGCGTSGFNASEGWDPVTGLGTPNFPKLKDFA